MKKFGGIKALTIGMVALGTALLASAQAQAQFLDPTHAAELREPSQNYAASLNAPQEPPRPVYTPSSTVSQPAPNTYPGYEVAQPAPAIAPVYREPVYSNPVYASPPIYGDTAPPVYSSAYPAQPSLPAPNAESAPLAYTDPVVAQPPPAVAPVAPPARKWVSQQPVYTIPVNTTSGFDLGLQFSDYTYQEHVVPNVTFAKLNGPRFGATLGGTLAYKSGFFFRADARAAVGPSDYTGGDTDLTTGQTIPATHSGETDWLFDGRILGGHDFVFGGDGKAAYYDISPYAGLGYRYLYNDGRGTDSNGVPGYQRKSHYIYIPLGVTQRLRVAEAERVSLTLEYDPLVRGYQVSDLNDTVAGATPLNNAQHDGYGLRGDVMYDWRKWSVGPFFNYWNVNQSDYECDNLVCGSEPHNQTIEYGVHVKYRFSVEK